MAGRRARRSTDLGRLADLRRAGRSALRAGASARWPLRQRLLPLGTAGRAAARLRARAISADGLQPFRIADLAKPNLELGGYRALFGVVIWVRTTRSTSPGAGAGAPASTSRSAGRRPACRVARSPIRGTTRSPTRSGTRSSSATGPSSRRTAASRTRSSGSTARSRSSSTESRSSAGTEARSRADEDPTPSFQGITPIFEQRQLCRAPPPPQAVQLIDLGCQPAMTNRSFQANTAAWSPGRDVGRHVERRRDRVPPRRRVATARSRGRSAAAAMAWRPDLDGSGNPKRDARPVSSGAMRRAPPLRRSAGRARRLGLRRQRTEP